MEDCWEPATQLRSEPRLSVGGNSRSVATHGLILP